MLPIEIVLPWPPTTNTAYATVKGRRVKTKSAREYAATAEALARLRFPTKLFSTHERLRVLIELRPPNRRAFDIANREKILIDAISTPLGFDDQQIDELTIRRLPAAPTIQSAYANVRITTTNDQRPLY